MIGVSLVMWWRILERFCLTRAVSSEKFHPWIYLETNLYWTYPYILWSSYCLVVTCLSSISFNSMENSVRIVSMMLPFGHVLSPDPGDGPHAASDKTWFLNWIILPLFTKLVIHHWTYRSSFHSRLYFTFDNGCSRKLPFFFAKPVSVCLVTMSELFEHSRTCPM